MDLVYICSAYRGGGSGPAEMEPNVARANRYCRFAMQSGVVPLAPHTIFTQFLDDTAPEERMTGLNLGREILARCAELWCFGRITEGMRQELDLAAKWCIPIRYYDTSCKEVKPHAD